MNVRQGFFSSGSLAYVDDPHLVCFVCLGHLQLMMEFVNVVCITPLVVSWIADVI